jgi:HK97 family phage prohead protease
MAATEERSYKATVLWEQRAIEENTKQRGFFKGHSIVYGQKSEDLGDFIEIIDRSAMDATDTADCIAVFNHNEDYILGSSEGGTLTLRSDETGMFTEIQDGTTTVHNNCREWVKRGDLRGMSFKFSDTESDWVYNEEQKIMYRTIKRIGKLWDVSLVARPAYRQTDVALRSLSEFKERNNALLDTVASKELRHILELKLKNRERWLRMQ